jgi:integrase
MTDVAKAARLIVPVSSWPAPDQGAWRRALRPFDPFDPSIGRACLWRASTRKTYEDGYGRFLAFLDSIGELERTAAPGDRATEVRLRAFYARLQADGLAPYTIAGHLMGLGRVLSAMHPDRDFSQITRASRRIHGQARPVSDVTERFRPLEEIRGLAWRLMWEADNGVFRNPVDRAILYRDGLILAFLCERPLRRANLAAIRIGEHLRRRGDEWWLTFPAAEMKNGRPFEFPWPQESSLALERYLAEHRKALLGPPGEDGSATDALWVSSGSKGALSYGDVGFRVKLRTREAFGTAINPHDFRYMAATLIAARQPESAPSIAGILAHTGPETAEKHYIKPGQVDAVLRYQEVLRETLKSGGRDRREKPKSDSSSRAVCEPAEEDN